VDTGNDSAGKRQVLVIDDGAIKAANCCGGIAELLGPPAS